MRDRVGEWEAFVKSLATETGYPDGLGLDDYYQDLVNRDFIERTETTAELRERVSAADESFRTNTFTSAQTRLSGDYWWHMKLPKRAGAELKAEAMRLGFLSSAPPHEW